MRRVVAVFTLALAVCSCEPDVGVESSPADDRGEILSLACQACHSLRAGEDHLIGPNLYRFFGRAAATAEGFRYSPALEASGIVWTPEELDRWLADPAGFLPGTTMAFTGYRSAGDREALIAYLIEATGGLPESE